jgi:hypothetical protein
VRGLAPETAAAFHRRIGNMVLLRASQNVDIGNASFSEKKTVFKNSAYKLTEEAGKESAWGVKEINERQQKLAKIALKTWAITVS